MKAEEAKLFTKYYTESKGEGDSDESFKNIPRFYYRVSFKHTEYFDPNDTRLRSRNLNCFIV